MNKTTYLIVFLLFFGTTSSVVFAQAPATITFDDQGFAGCDELNDAQVFSAIGKTFNIYAANFDGTPSENGSLWYESASGGCWHPYATVMGDGGYITAGYSSNSAYQWYDPKALAIKTIDGSDFKFISFKSHDASWDKWGNYLKITGYKDGVSLGSESVVIVSDVEPYYSTVTLTNPVFNSVDEVRITMDKDNNPQFNDPGIVHSDADGLFQSFDTFVIDNAVSSASAPTISTAIASAITDAGATLNGNVTSDGGATVSANGFVYSSTDTSPTIGEGGVTNVPNSNVGTGAFSEAISGLSASTTYYYQAYATNSEGTTYGGVQSFTTNAANTPPTVYVNNGLIINEGTTGLIDSGKLNATDAETGGGTDIVFTITSAVSHGILFIDSNPTTVFESGDVELVENETFTLDDINNVKIRYTNTDGSASSDSFVFKVSDPDGGELTNQTFNITINHAPTVTTNAISTFDDSSATVGGNVTDNGGTTVTESGIVYNTSGAPTTLDTKVQIGSGDGIFTSNITGLTADTKYYVRAYAINSAGTSYGNEESFTTLATLGLQDDIVKQAISLYPNPVNDVLYIKTNNLKVANVMLFDVLGKRITNIKIKNDAINLSHLKMGIYILKMETAQGNVVKRIIKK